jgi:hypothetical protein
MTSPWVHAIELAEKKASFDKRVDSVVSVLERFAIIASRNFRYRKVYTAKMVEFYRKRAANPRRFKHGEMSWADIMEIEDERLAIERAAEEVRRQAARDAYEARLIAMPERELVIYHQRTMAEHRRYNEDFRPWLEFIAKIHAKRAAARGAVDEAQNVWREMSFAAIGVPVRLHNTQAATKKRVVQRNSSVFAAMSDSDSE